MRKHCYIFIIILLVIWGGLSAQPITRYNTFSYNVNEGLLQSTIGDIDVDKNNFCWISFPNGIQQFDGNNFKIIKIQPGLPDDKHTNLFRCKNRDLLIGHSQGISRYDADEDRFTLAYKQDPSLRSVIEFIGEDDGILYFTDGAARITGMEIGSYKITGSVKTGFPAFGTLSDHAPRIGDNILNHRFAFWMNNTVYVWDLRKGKIVYQSQPLERSYSLLYLLSGDKVLYANDTDTKSLQCLDLIKSTHKSVAIRGKNNEIGLSRIKFIKWQDKYLFAINSRLYETDSTFLVLKSELVNFQNQPVGLGHTIADIVEDNFGNLYMQTVTGGIRKIIRNNYPFRYYGSIKKEDNQVISVLPDKKNNRILVGTAVAGLFVFDTLQRLVKHIPKILNDENQFGITSIIKDPGDGYLLFARGKKNIWKLNSGLSSFTSYPVHFVDTPQHVINYFGNILYQDDRKVVVQSMHQLFRTHFADKKTTAYRISGEYTLGSLWYNNKIIYHANEELIFLDGQTFRAIKRIPFPNTGGVRCFAKDGEAILLGTNKGVFRIDIDGKILYHWNKEKGLPDDCIYAITTDKNGYVWCSSNKGIFRIDNKNNLLQLVREDGLQENEFNTNVVARTEDGEIFFGGMNGVSSFYPSSINSYEEKINMLLTRIRVNNTEFANTTAVWNIEKIKLPYAQNSLSFDFVAMGNNNPSQYIYQYKMKGLDKEWLQNSGLQTIRYSLPPGKYTLQLYASRSFDKDAKPMKEINIIIQPPFWKTWWFLAGLVALIISLLIYGINQSNKRKYAKKFQQLENERQIKLERERISKDLHDSLGAYANAVLYKTEQLEKEKGEMKKNELIGDLKFASKDIITSLRETVWAMKKETYTAEDCLFRIRNFIQPFIRYYEHIQFRITGEAPADRVLHYTKALNLVRIVQEAVSNSIKHAGSSHVIISCGPAGNKWKIVIADDGKGFDYAAAKKEEQGNGLYNMEHRAANSGLEFTIASKRNEGTTITIIV